MPNPVRRHSKARRDKRRTHDRLVVNSLAKCSQCNEERLPHRVCPHCGYYKGRPVIEIDKA